MGSYWQLLLGKVKNLGLFTMTNKATVLLRCDSLNPLKGQRCLIVDFVKFDLLIPLEGVL